MPETDREGVRVIDVNMPFGSMVKFMVKWAIAAIPALIILMVIGTLVGSLIAGFTAAVVTRSTGESSAPSVSLLSADTGLLSGGSATPSVPQWDVSESTNPIDDTPTVVLSLQASSPSSTTLRDAPRLIVRCKSKETDVYISWSEFLGSDEIIVTTRLGRNAAARRSWSLSTDSRASFYPARPAGFVKQLMAVDTLVAMTTPYNEAPITATFEVTGLSEKIVPLRKACGW
jgi:type VI secretion system protein VasI